MVCSMAEKNVCEPDWGARPQRSIKDELYYVSCSSISCSGRGNDGRRIEFRKCRRTKAKRTVIVLAFLVLLDLALSTAVVRQHGSTLLFHIMHSPCSQCMEY